MELAELFERVAAGFRVYDTAENGDYRCSCTPVRSCPNCETVAAAGRAVTAGRALIAGLRPGGTNAFPDGRLNEEDEGELQMALLIDPPSGNIVLNFGKAIRWTAFPPAQAREIAALLLQKAGELEGAPARG